MPALGRHWTPPQEYCVVDTCLVTSVENFAVVALYPVVLMFATLSEIIPIALDCDVNPETPDLRAPNKLMISLPLIRLSSGASVRKKA